MTGVQTCALPIWSWRDVAILMKTKTDIDRWYQALEEAEIPVEVVGIQGLLAVPEVADVVATLHLIDDPTCNPDLVRLLTGPRWSIGPSDLRILGHVATDLAMQMDRESRPEATREGVRSAFEEDVDRAVAARDTVETPSLLDAVLLVGRPGAKLPKGADRLSAEGRSKLLDFASAMRTLRRSAGASPSDLVQQVVEAFDLDIEVRVRDGGVGSRALQHFFQVVDDFKGLDGGVSLRALLAYLSAAGDDDNELDHALPSADDSVKLMTIHKAKGLEWPCVVLPLWLNNVFPSYQGRAKWTSQGHAVPVDLLRDGHRFRRIENWANKEAIKGHNAELLQATRTEDRRLAYVAVTRARQHLLCSTHWWGPTQVTPRGPSTFLTEIQQVPGVVREFDAQRPEKTVKGEWSNPMLRSPLAPWPPPSEPEDLAQRRAAAEEVRKHLPSDDADAVTMSPAEAFDGWPVASTERAEEWVRLAREAQIQPE